MVGMQPSRPVHAIFVRLDSEIDHPAQLADQPIAVNFHAGSHFTCIRMLEGFLGRRHLKMLHYGGQANRFDAMMRGEVAAAVLFEPYIALAEKLGCKLLIEGFFTATDVARDDLDAETLGALYRALGRAVVYLNADPEHKKKYIPYLFADIPENYRWGKPNVEDFRLARLRFALPRPYPEPEFKLTYDLMVRWGLLSPDATYETIVSNRVVAVQR